MNFSLNNNPDLASGYIDCSGSGDGSTEGFAFGYEFGFDFGNSDCDEFGNEHE